MSSANSPLPRHRSRGHGASAHKRQPLRVPRASGRSGDRRCGDGLGSSWRVELRGAAPRASQRRLHGPLAHGTRRHRSSRHLGSGEDPRSTLTGTPGTRAIEVSADRSATIVGGQQVLEAGGPRRGCGHHPRPRYSVQSAGVDRGHRRTVRRRSRHGDRHPHRRWFGARSGRRSSTRRPVSLDAPRTTSRSPTHSSRARR